MTLTTKVAVIGDIDRDSLFTLLQNALGGHGRTVEADGDIHHMACQGFDALIWCGERTCDDIDLSGLGYPLDKKVMVAYMDTPYGAKPSASQIHDRIVRELGESLSDLELDWYLYNDMDCRWHYKRSPSTIRNSQ